MPITRPAPIRRGARRPRRPAIRSRSIAIALTVLGVVLLGVVASVVARGRQSRRAAELPPSPTPASFVADGGPVLAPDAHAALDARIRTVQETTGGDVAVAVVPDLGGRAPADAGLALYRAWKVGATDRIGSPHRDLGALLLVVPKELAPNGRGECWVTTGLGAEGTLTDSRAARICREGVIPHLRRRDHAAALAAGVDSIATAFGEAIATTDSAADAETEDPAGADERAAAQTDAATGEGMPAAEDVSAAEGMPIAAPAARSDPDRAVRLLMALGVGAVLTGGYAGVAQVRRHRRRRCPRGHGPMTRLHELADDAALTPAQQAEEKLRSVDYDVWACRRCDARAVIPYAAFWTRYHPCGRCRGRAATRTTRTLCAATTTSTGVEEVTFDCLHCGWQKVERRTIPRRTSSGSGAGGSRSFGGSGSSSGGGGGASY